MIRVDATTFSLSPPWSQVWSAPSFQTYREYMAAHCIKSRGLRQSFLADPPAWRESRTDSRMDEFRKAVKVGFSPDVVDIIVIGALDHIERFGRLGCLEYLPAKLERNDLVLIAVHDQFWQ